MGLTLIISLILCLIVFWPAPTYYNGPKSDHFNGKTFSNQERKDRNLFQLIKWLWTRHPEKWPQWVDITTSIPPERSQELRITFINHASFLIQWNNLNILTDPIYSERASPFSSYGPKRVHEPGIKFEDLPPIDYVLISHNHYDHLDLPTLKKLVEKDHPRFITGLGNDRYLEKEGIQNVIALDWWETSHGFTFVPAEHFSARWYNDRNRTLWGGFLIHHKNEYLYFAGDTGFGPQFSQIQSRYGSPFVSFLPIGAYEPRWFMEVAHMDPIDAMEAHRLLGSKNSIGMHFGTFRLADESREAPLEMLKNERTTERFFTLDPGESVVIHEQD